MERTEFRQAVFACALALGCESAETYEISDEGFYVSVMDQEVDDYRCAREGGVGVRVIVKGKNGYAYTEALEDPEAVVRHAMDNAASIENDDTIPMLGPQSYQTVHQPEQPLCQLSERKKIELALQMERLAKEADPRFARTEVCAVQTSRVRVGLYNTLGLCAEKERESGSAMLAAIAEQDGQPRSGFTHRAGQAALSAEVIAREAVAEAVAQFGASPVAAGDYPVVLRNDAAASLLQGFSRMFSADAAQKGLSLLAGREGTSIASSVVTILDDPLDPHAPSAFDAEGTPSVAKTVVKNGVLATLLHNTKTARKAGVSSTSNASRAPGGPVEVAPTNFYILPGTQTPEQLLEEMGDGLLITEISGLHAGLNPVSGSFSLLAGGALVQGGKIVRPVEQITVAGSFIPLLQDVQAVGDDLSYDRFGHGGVGSPSLRIGRLKVAGAE